MTRAARKIEQAKAMILQVMPTAEFEVTDYGRGLALKVPGEDGRWLKLIEPAWQQVDGDLSGPGFEADIEVLCLLLKDGDANDQASVLQILTHDLYRRFMWSTFAE